MKVGDFAETRRAFSAEDVAAFERLGGGPVGQGSVPEPLIGALFSYLLGVQLPGPGANYLKQQTDYLAAAALGDTLTARVQIVRLRPAQRLIELETTCLDSHGGLVARGRAVVSAQDVDLPFEV